MKVGVTSLINEKGAYIGTFTRAEYVNSPKGTQGIEFDFKSNDGQTAKYLTIWTVNGDGKELYGRSVIDAIMTAVGVRELQAAPVTVPKWDNVRKEDVNETVTGFKALMGPQIGLVLCREEYASNQGERKWKSMIVCPFEASTRRTAGERLKQAVGADVVMLDRIMATLADRPLKSNARPAPSNTGAGAGFGGGFDDIPNDDMDF